MSKIKKQIAVVVEWHENRTKNEKLLMHIVVLLFVYFIASNIIGNSIISKNQSLNRQVIQKENEVDMLNKEITKLSEAVEKDEYGQKKSLIAQHNESLNEVDKYFAEANKEIISSRTMVQLLRDLSEKQPGVSVIEIQGLSSSAIDVNDENNIDTQISIDSLFYKHGLMVVLEADFFSLVNYLKTIEQLNWGVYWEEMVFNIETYPKGKVMIQIYTLSNDEHLIGV